MSAGLTLLLVSGVLLPEEALAHGDSIREYMAEMIVEQGSPLEDRSIEDAGLRALSGLFLAEIERAGDTLLLEARPGFIAG